MRTAHIISHTHWDREWYLNSPYTNAWLVPFFDSLFKMLEKETSYRFVLDGQTSMIEDWCAELKSQGKDADLHLQRLSSYVKEQRVCVGPYYLQPDWQLVSEEALVRNLLIGQHMTDDLGGRMPVGWLLDNFGQISQAPQIHREFGLRGLFVWRGVEMDPEQIQSEFTWEAPDGSQVTAIYLVGSYRNGMRLAEYPQAMAGRILGEIKKLSPFASTPNVLIMNGYDQEMLPDDILPMLKNGLNQLGDVRVVQSTPPEYLDAVIQSLDPQHPLKTLHGALYSGRYISVFPGILSSRMYLKIQNNVGQKLLEKGTEPMAAVLWSLGLPYPAVELERAWKLLLKNHPHDSICAVSIDDVHSDMETRFQQSAAIARQCLSASLAHLSANIDTRWQAGTLQCWVVVNTALKPADGLVEIRASLPENVFFCDGDGKVLPIQKNMDGVYLVSLTAIPALGYQTLYALDTLKGQTGKIDQAKENEAWLRVNQDDFTVENAWIKLVVGPDGRLELTDQRSHVSYADLAIFEDGGDAGDTYNYSFPIRDRIFTSQGQTAEISFMETGPLRVRLKIKMALKIPASLAPDRIERDSQACLLPVTTIVTVEANSALVKFHTQVCNTARDHRIRVLFPTAIDTSVSHAETQFDVVTRPITPQAYDDSTIPENVKQVIMGAREPKPVTIFPQRAFVDLNNGACGLAVLNQGLPEYEILPDQNTIALTLFRSVGWIARPDLLTRIGDAGPLIAVPGAQCLRTMAFDYAVLVHDGDWQSGQVVQQADLFNSRLLVVATSAHSGPLPPAGGFLRLEDASGQLKVTAVKRTEDGRALTVRFHNPTSTRIMARMESAFQIKQACYTNLAEEPGEPISTEDHHSLPVSAGPKKIVTIRLEIEPLDIVLTQVSPDRMIEEPDKGDIHDFSTIMLPQSISAEDIARESHRSADLEAVLVQKEGLLQDFLTQVVPQDASAVLKMYQLRLDAASSRRTALEARLSKTLLEKNFWEMQPVEQSTGTSRLAQYKAYLRQIGDEINTARVEKRALEYMVDYYSRLVT
jgi:mannosylglycerate hydrolase